MNKAELFDVVVVATIKEGLSDEVRISGGVMKVIRYAAYCTAGLYPISEEPNQLALSYDSIINQICATGTCKAKGINLTTYVTFTVEK